MRNAAAKLTFIIVTFNVTFINKSPGDMYRTCPVSSRTIPADIVIET